MTDANPLRLQPAGNAYVRSGARNSRSPGLGHLAVLSDELLAYIWEQLELLDYFRIERTSRFVLSLCRQEAQFKNAFLRRIDGRLENWQGSWRATVRHALGGPASPEASQRITAETVFSDVLYTPHLCASFDPASITAAPSFRETIPRIDARDLGTCADLPTTPCILTHAMDNWPASSSSDSARRWTLANLAKRCPTQLFRAEAVLCTLDTYRAYAADCPQEDSPVYLFESDFVEKGAQAGLAGDVGVPAVFDEDLFEVLGGQRPDYRWLIAGPKRSGSTFHQDPNNTSAWNAVITGAKLWVTFPNHITPPGVRVSSDMAEVHTPDSVSEWFLHYYATARARYGPTAKDPKLRGTMQEGVCRAGEVFHVPSTYWHAVINLEESIAVTQNYVSKRELAAVLHFLKTRPEQVSGFKLISADEDCEEERGDVVFERLCKALQRDHRDVLLEALKEVARRETSATKTSVWDRLEARKEESAFGFGFEVDGGGVESEDSDA